MWWQLLGTHAGGLTGVHFALEHGVRSRESNSLHLYVNQLQHALNELDDTSNGCLNMFMLLSASIAYCTCIVLTVL